MSLTAAQKELSPTAPHSLPLSAQEIREVLVREDDFGHEMRVGAAIRCISTIEMSHGGTYTDGVTGKPRQYDFRCELQKGEFSMSLAVECKNLSKLAPLVITGSARRKVEAFHHVVVSRNGQFQDGSYRFTGLSSTTIEIAEENDFYPADQFVGRSVVRPKREENGGVGSMPDADVYDKWSQALSSSIDLANHACNLAAPRGYPKYYSAVLPVLVVPDGTLWGARYNDSGELNGDPLNLAECAFYVDREIRLHAHQREFSHSFEFSHINFFTLSGFHSFLSKIAVNDHAWTALLPEDLIEQGGTPWS